MSSPPPANSPKKFRLTVLLLLAVLSLIIGSFFSNSIDRHVRTQMALQTVNGDSSSYVAAEGYQNLSAGARVLFMIVIPGVLVFNIFRSKQSVS